MNRRSRAKPLHKRAIEIHGYKRADGLYDIEGHLVDTKAYDFKLAAGVRHAGDPVHGMWLRITVDKGLTIVDAAAAMDAMPYVDYCDAIVPAYKLLIGLAIRPGYHQRAEGIAGRRARLHAHHRARRRRSPPPRSRRWPGSAAQDPAKKPFQLDRCHALALTGARGREVLSAVVSGRREDRSRGRGRPALGSW